jgi:hypothetical protein
MIPVNLRFEYSLKSNDTEAHKYKGISVINDVFVQAFNDTRGQGYKHVAIKDLLPINKDLIAPAFKEDFSKIGFALDTVNYQINLLDISRTSIPYQGEAYAYEVDIKLISPVYTCVQIISEKEYVCYLRDADEKELIHLPVLSLRKTVV